MAIENMPFSKSGRLSLIALFILFSAIFATAVYYFYDFENANSYLNQMPEKTENITESYTNSKITPANNITIISEALQNYHKDHTYSIKDLFVCSDMAIDVWNIIKSKGFEAKIKIGNIDNDTINKSLNFTQYNHAWVMAKIDNKWYALETTGGFVAERDKYPLYYRKSIEFNGSAEFKSYLDLIKKYNTEVNITKQILELCNIFYLNYTKELDYYNSLADEWNLKYFEKPITDESELFKEKLEEQNAKTKEYENKYKGCSDSLAKTESIAKSTYKKIIDFEK